MQSMATCVDGRSTQIVGDVSVMREYVWLECTICGDRNYRVQKETRGANRLELKKYCRRERKHTPHKESRKK
jgi:large subunit ribosomal protein L33